MTKLQLNEELIQNSRLSAHKIAKQVYDFIQERSTVSIERTALRLSGIDGVNDEGIPYVNILVDDLQRKGILADGSIPWLVKAMITYGATPQEIAELVDLNKVNWQDVRSIPFDEVQQKGLVLANQGLNRLKKQRKIREELIAKSGEGDKPFLYVIVATGDIFEDVVQAKAAVRQGADIIAVIRTTGQSLLDYIPYGATREGYGGTYATQENFKIMRQALDEVSSEVNRYVSLCNYSSGLCMPEIAAVGGMERLDVMLNDALYGILFRDINMQRTLIDQAFSRMIISISGIIINTGEDNYLTTADAVEEAHTVLASQFINEQFAILAGLPNEQMGLGHAFEINPKLENGFLLEIAQAQLARQIFPKAPLKYMPPTKYMTGNIFMGYLQNALFNIAGVMTNQGIQLLGMMTEAMHTPHMLDRKLAIDNAKYIKRNMKDLHAEIEFKSDGFIANRANDVLIKATKMLGEIEELGLFEAISQGRFANVKRSFYGGKGLEGVFIKQSTYFNPFEELMKKELGIGG